MGEGKGGREQEGRWDKAAWNLHPEQIKMGSWGIEKIHNIYYYKCKIVLKANSNVKDYSLNKFKYKSNAFPWANERDMKGRSREKKNHQKPPMLGTGTFDCLEDDAGDLYHSKYCLGTSSRLKWKKDGTQQWCPISRHKSANSSLCSWNYPYKRFPCSQINMLSSPYISNYYLSRNHTYMMTNTKGVSESLSTLNFAFSNISR